MIDLHTHTLLSDGELVPSELVRRALVKGYRVIALTDHMDESNLDFVVPRIVRVAEKLNSRLPITVMPGAEITHVPPADIPFLVKEARKLGAKIVIVHGETIVEPVAEGTNRAAIESDADILSHPGLISDEDMKMAAGRNIYMEITARKGHSLSNGHVAAKAGKYNVPLVVNTDSHSPADLITRDFAERVLLSAGLDRSAVSDIFAGAEELVRKVVST